MTTIIEAIFDGHVIRPEEPLILEPNTRIKVTIEKIQQDTEKKTSFLQTARSLNLDGPPDWALNLDDYLYGDPAKHHG